MVAVVIQVATTDDEVSNCYVVMRELRPHLSKEQFLVRVRKQEKSGYRLVFLREEGVVVAVAGFRSGENLAWGRFLYVDDLVTASAFRSRGFGAKLLSWLRQYAVSEGCLQLHLDSGVQRQNAHRFYEREGMLKSGFHFFENIGADKTD